MISVEEVILDPDMCDPSPFTVLRSSGQWVAGGFQSAITQQLQTFGPVRVATNKELAMLAEADRVSQVRAFYATFPILVTRGQAPLPATHGEVPQGTIPGVTYALSEPPPATLGVLTINGLFQRPNGYDYTLNGVTITLNTPTDPDDKLYFTWPITAMVGAAESDVIDYDNQQWRILSVYRTPGSGYWKALGTRLSAS